MILYTILESVEMKVRVNTLVLVLDLAPCFKLLDSLNKKIFFEIVKREVAALFINKNYMDSNHQNKKRKS